jgi:phytoene dehydrogenase-like protein
MSPDYDIAVVGAGHNALVAAAYLAQAGKRVAVFERRQMVGGAVGTTDDWIPGYRVDVGGSAHILIRVTPIVEELGLKEYGLEYLELDPMFSGITPDEAPVHFYRDVDRTVDAMDAMFPGQGAAYRRFHETWLPFAELVRDMFLSVPGPLSLGRRMAFDRTFGKHWREALSTILKPYGEALPPELNEARITTPMTWMAAQSGPPPHEPMSAPFLLWHPMYHVGGVARPRGGSGMLSVALADHIRDHGGEIHTGASVDEIVTRDGKAAGVRVDGTVYTARAVLSGAHIHETVRLLPDAEIPARLRRTRPGNGFGAMLRVALDGPVVYADPVDPSARTGLQLICRDRAQLDAAYGDYVAGRPASDPPLVAMTFSEVDDTLAPDGHEVLWLWAQYYPYELADGRRWDEIADGVADSILETFERYAPGTRDRVVDTVFQHPLWLERELGLRRGNVMHLEMSLDQMFLMRPALGSGLYKGPVKQLFLTGASTHPGGGIMGASGRNAAEVVLKALNRRFF